MTAAQLWSDLLREDYSPDDARKVREFLTLQGTFLFPTLATGLFSASAGQGEEFEQTGYRNVWVRDTIHIAHAHLVIGERMVAVRAVSSLIQYFSKHRQRFVDVIEGRADPSEPMQRPQIRFDGDHLRELPEKWAHAQNDALGYTLWLYALLVGADVMPVDAAATDVLSLMVRYFQAVRFWQDEDSGHWEETRKIEASSIGAVTAGLVQLERLMIERALPALNGELPLVRSLIEQGQGALRDILPWECRQTNPQQQRRYDSALLFLCYPLKIVDEEMEATIVDDVTTHLQGAIGIRRYLGDSYWCADYKTLLPSDERTVDFSDNLGARDRLLQPGDEAQWCIFDPIISVIFARRHARTNAPEDRSRQMAALNRSLRQLTTAESRFGAFRCPESYFRERGEWVPNDITPLLWTQANLRLALHFAEHPDAA